MKNQYFIGLARVLVVVFVGGGIFGSCIKKPNIANATKQNIDVTYHFDGGADMPSLFSLYATYTNATGGSFTERIENLPWTVIVSTKRPFNPQLKVTFSTRNDFAEKPLYDIGFDGYITYVSPESGEKGEIRTQSRAAGVGESLKLRFTYPDETSAQQASLRVAPLRYDKRFAFTLTVDDCWTNAWSGLWSLMNGKWVDDQIYHHMGRPRTSGYTPEYPLTMTDGCGNDRRFGFSCAVWSSWGNAQNTTFIKDLADTGDKSIYLAWEELGLMNDFGVSLLFHNVDERVWDKTNVSQVASGLMEDYVKVNKKLGIQMKIMGLPDGNKTYLDAAKQVELISFTRNSLARNKIHLNTCGDLHKLDTYGGERSQAVSDKMMELAQQREAADPFWVAMTIHGPKAEHMQMLKDIYGLYGKAGSDDLWVASWDEIYEYVTLREWAKSRITRTVDGCTVVFDIPVPACDGYQFKGLTFLADGGKLATVAPASEQIVGLTYAPKDDALLVNIAFGDRLPRLAEKYTTIYEMEPSVEALADARYFVEQLLPELAKPLEERIKDTPTPGKNQITRKGVGRYQAQWNGYKFAIGQKIEQLK